MTVPGFRRLPLFWKILIPFTTLLVVVGGFGAFLIVRTLASRAQGQLDQELSRRALEVRSTLRDRELYLLESATLAANLEGMAQAIAERRTETVEQLARSVLALKTDLDLLVITDRSAKAIIEMRRSRSGIGRTIGARWGNEALAAPVLSGSTLDKQGGLLTAHGEATLAVVSPVCSTSPGCSARGLTIVGISVKHVIAATAGAGMPGRGSVAFYDPQAGLRASAGSIDAARLPRPAVQDEPVVRRARLAGEEIATIYVPYEIQGRLVGRLAVSTPTAPALASAREAAVRFGIILVLAMAGVIGIGALISRRILAQVSRLVSASRALGAGDLSTRAVILGEDEIGELAEGLNAMAEQLQASYETLESRVTQRTAEVQRLLQERTEFFAAISHELRTPLAVIIAQAELMRDPTYRKTAKWTAETGTAIGDSARQLQSLVNDILDLARAEAGKLVVSMDAVDVGEIISAARPTIDGLARAGEIDVSLDVPSSLVGLCDPGRFREVLLNLVDNAVKYTPPDGQIRISAERRTDDFIEISVSDTGIGIPPEVGDRIFEPFFRVFGSDTQRGQASTGLGLSLARRLVEAMGGVISYASDRATGTTFVFTLPSARPKAEPAAIRPGRRGTVKRSI